MTADELGDEQRFGIGVCFLSSKKLCCKKEKKKNSYIIQIFSMFCFYIFFFEREEKIFIIGKQNDAGANFEYR